MKKLRLLLMTALLTVLGGGSVLADNCLKFTIPQLGTNLYDSELHYIPETPLAAGVKYTFSIKLKSDKIGEFSFWPSGTEYVMYLTAYMAYNDWTYYSWEFTPTSALNNVKLELGKLAGDIYIDDVVLLAEGSSDNLIDKGDFETGLSEKWTKPGWHNTTIKLAEAPTGENNHALKITTTEAKDKIWDWQIHYDLPNKLVTGTSYELTMRMKASSSCQVNFWPKFFKEDGNEDTQYTGGFTVTEQWRSYTCNFKAEHDLYRLAWVFGTFKGDLYIDDVRLVVKETDDNLVAYGDFEKGFASSWGKPSWHSLTFERNPNDGYSDKMTGTDAPSDDLTVEMFKNYSSETPTQAGCAFVLNSSTAQPYGDGSVGWKNYADLSSYDRLAITVSEGAPRCCINREVDGGEGNDDPASSKMLDFNKVWVKTKYQTQEGSTYYIEIARIVADYGHAYLHCIKGANWANVNVSSMKLLKKADCGYYISGVGSTEDVQSALNEPTLTSVDATGLTNEEAIAITTGNPNCLIIANTGMLSNPDNVLIKGADDSYSCASLSLKDANDFAAPVAFTATIAKLVRDAKGYDGWATVCLPFEASVPSGVKAWEIESVNAGVLNMKSITTIPANKAVLLQFDEATGLAVYASSATVAKTVAASESGKTELVGVYAKQQAPVGSYVLQKKNGTLAFYKVETDKQPNIPAFRAYLTVDPSAAKGNVMRINFEETTGISDMQNNETILTPAMKYNMAGQSVKHMKKGVQIQRMSDGSVRKVMVK